MQPAGPCPVQPGVFLLDGPLVHDEQRLSGGHPHAQHPAALRRGRLRGLLPARYRQVQPRRPVRCRGGLLHRHPPQPRLHAGLHLPRHHPLAPGKLRRRLAGLPRGHRTAPRPPRPLLQPRRHTAAEPAVQGGHRGFRQIHPPGEQGRRRLHLPRVELPPTPPGPTKTSTPPSAPTAKTQTGTTAAEDSISTRSVTRRPRPTSTRPSSATPRTCSRSSTARWSTTPRTVRCRPWRTSTA